MKSARIPKSLQDFIHHLPSARIQEVLRSVPEVDHPLRNSEIEAIKARATKGRIDPRSAAVLLWSIEALREHRRIAEVQLDALADDIQRLLARKYPRVVPGNAPGAR